MISEQRIDDLLRAFLAEEADRVREQAPSLDAAVADLAARLVPRRGGHRQLAVILAAVLLLIVTLASAIAVGSGLLRTPAVQEPATLDELTGAWQPEPLQLSAAMVAELDANCRKDPNWPLHHRLMLVDARGGGRALLTYAGAGGRSADCEAAIGVTGVTWGWLTGESQWNDVQAIAAAELRLRGGGGQLGGPRAAPSDPIWYGFWGQAGPDIHRVIIEVPGLPSVVASLENGWFAAWWPSAGEARIVGLDEAGAEAAEELNPYGD